MTISTGYTDFKGESKSFGAHRGSDLGQDQYQAGRLSVLRELWDLLDIPNSALAVTRFKGDLVALSVPNNGVTTEVNEKIRIFSSDELAATDSERSMFKVGWYQDNEANMYYYEGESHWKNVDLATNKLLTLAVVAGELEHIG